MLARRSFARAAFLCGFGLLVSSPLLAQFSGDYAVDNWQEILVGIPPAGGGQVDLAGAPGSIRLVGGDDGCGDLNGPGPEGAPANNRGELPPEPVFSCLLAFVIEATDSGSFSFQWDYQTEDEDGPEFDVFGYIVNEDLTPLSQEDGAAIQSGVETVAVNAGDQFGFFIDCTDCVGGAADAVISGFSGPAGTPPPPPALAVPVNNLSALLLLSLLLLALGSWVIRVGR